MLSIRPKDLTKNKDNIGLPKWSTQFRELVIIFDDKIGSEPVPKTWYVQIVKIFSHTELDKFKKHDTMWLKLRTND